MPDTLICSFVSCANPSRARGWCGGHYKQWQQGGSLRPLQNTPEFFSSRLNEEGKKKCSRCGYWLDLTEFYARSDAGRYNTIRIHCNRCNTLRRMGITAKQYDDMLVKQGGGCAICGVEACRSGKAFCVDHDHSCCNGNGSCGKCVRGLLCNDCNAMLGFAHDDTDRLAKAIEYLR